RCTATTQVDDETRALAETITSPHDSIEWASYPVLQCLLEDVDHDFHAAFFRTGSRTDPDSDVFVCWRDGTPGHALADLDCCMNRSSPLATGCTIFQHHPGRCEWDYIDPPMVAAQAQADQIAAALGLFRGGCGR
ncbi:hypothetical protein, partial [Streptomyces griseoloalbus]|uniref:hypothetical protein n=1 Tax=Streptomyces griseoloalbus TaxID=67303 RepID=UPI00296FB7C7